MKKSNQEVYDREEEEADDSGIPDDIFEAGDELKSEMDDLLDEIDGVLETNAAEFVNGYVQKGGQ